MLPMPSQHGRIDNKGLFLVNLIQYWSRSIRNLIQVSKVSLPLFTTTRLLIPHLDHRVGQIRVIFSIPQKVWDELFPPDTTLGHHFAYIEWFTEFQASPDPNHGMYAVSRTMQDGQRIASIIPLSHIQGSVHLFPKFGPVAPRQWTSSNVLDLC